MKRSETTTSTAFSFSNSRASLALEATIGAIPVFVSMTHARSFPTGALSSRTRTFNASERFEEERDDMFDSFDVKHRSSRLRSRPAPLIRLKELRDPVTFPAYFADGTDLLSERANSFRMEIPLARVCEKLTQVHLRHRIRHILEVAKQIHERRRDFGFWNRGKRTIIDQGLGRERKGSEISSYQ